MTTHHNPPGLGTRLLCLFGLLCGSFLGSSSVFGAALDELPVDRWKDLREAERYQLQIAEKYYREQNWKVALAEYEKFIELYEMSTGAAFAQLKWSICQTKLRKQNTAIKEGFQSVIDYWPDSPEAIAASYFMARTYKEIGEAKKAKQAYLNVLEKHKAHLVGVYARVDLIDVARVEKDDARRVALWRELTYDVPRNGDTNPYCQEACRQLAVHQFYSGVFDEGVKALATTYVPDQMPYYVTYYVNGPIAQMVAADESKPKGEKVADAGIAWLRTQIPSDIADPAKKAYAKTVWYYIADLQAAAKRIDSVPETYAQIEKIFGVEDDTLARFAAWLKTQNKRDEARRTYARYVNKPEGQGQVAYSYREEQKYDSAIPIYRTLSVQDQEHAPRWLAEMAMTYRHGGKCDEAVGVYRELLSADTKNQNSWQMQIGYTYRDFGRWKEAIQNFRLADSFPEGAMQMAWCHRHLKEYKEAVILYQQVMIGHEPSAPEALMQIGYTHESAGEKEKAIRSFQQVCDKFNGTGHASAAHAYLQDKFKISYTKGGGKSE